MTGRVGRRGRALGICLGALLAAPPLARAGGLFLPLQGLRPSMQGGAYVAAPHDVYALSYNPAGLADAPNGALAEVVLPLHFSQLVGADAAAPSAAGRGLGLPIPTLGIAYDFGLAPRWQFAAALTAPLPAIQSYPQAVRQAGAFGRYGAADFSGTVLTKLLVGAAFRPSPALALGLAGHLWLGRLVTRSVVSACDGLVCQQPENALYDADVQLTSRPLVLPGGQLGVSWTPFESWTVGAAFESGVTLSRDADLQLRLPSAPLYDAAQVTPAAPTAHLRLRLPWSARLGVAYVPNERWAADVAAVFEPWSVHQRIDVEPQQVVLQNIAALGRFVLPPLQIPRNFQNTYSLRLGGAYHATPLPLGLPLTLRGGVVYEPSSVPDVWQTPMGFSLAGCLLSLGLEVEVGRWTLLAGAAHGAYWTRQVSGSAAPQINAVGLSALPRVGNGTYRAQANLAGVGMQTTF